MDLLIKHLPEKFSFPSLGCFTEFNFRHKTERIQSDVQVIVNDLIKIEQSMIFYLDRGLRSEEWYDPSIHIHFTKIMKLLAHYATLPIGKKAVDLLRSLLSNETLSNLRRITSLGESMAEKFQARNLLAWLGKDFKKASLYINDFDKKGLSETQVSLQKLARFMSPPNQDFRMFDEYFIRARAEFRLIQEALTGIEPTFVFGGSGAIDLSADMISILAASNNISLKIKEIDVDESALELAIRLYDYKVKLEILTPECKEFFCENIENIKFVKPNSSHALGRDECGDCFCADVLSLAIMIPPSARARVLHGMHQAAFKTQTPGVLLRGAQGLVADLFYDNTNTQEFFSATSASCFFPLHVASNDPDVLLKVPEDSYVLGSSDVLTSSWYFKSYSR
jgi:hypothetical protein